MKKILKSRIFAFILGAVIFSGITALATGLIASSVSYTPTWTKSNGEDIVNVSEALDELYTRKQLSSVTLFDKISKVGNETTTYTFKNDLDLGLVIITSSNNINDTSYYVSNINSLSNGNYSVIDDSAIYIGGGNEAGHRSKIYLVEGITSGTTMQVSTRYASEIQILELN